MRPRRSMRGGLARGLAILAITFVGLAGAGLFDSEPANAATCSAPSVSPGQLLVNFDTTNESVEIYTDGITPDYYVSANSASLCTGPISSVTQILVTHGLGTGQSLSIGQSPDHPWSLTGGVTIDSGVDSVQILWGLTAPGAISIGAPVVACNSTLALTSSTSISITGAINTAGIAGACLDLPVDVTLTAPSVSVGGAIGTINPVNSVTIDSQTSRATIGGSVTTTGAQAYDGAGLAISGSRTLTASTVTAAGGFDGAAGSSLTISQTGSSQINGQITGALALTKAGTGTLTLWGSNAYTGATTVSAGTLDVINNDGLGDYHFSATSVSAGATLRLRAAIFPWNDISLASTAVLQSTGTSTNVLNGQLTTTGTPTIDIADTATLILSGGVAGGGFTKTGTGTLTLNESATNTGATTVSAGLLRVTGSGNPLGSNAGGTTVASGAALELAGSSTIIEPLTISGTGIAGAGALVTSSSAQTLSGSLTVGSGATITTGTALTASGSVSGSGLLTKAGTARLTLSGANGSHAGGTRVTAGELRVSSATGLGSSGVTVDGGASLTVAGVTLPSGNTIATTGSGTAEIAGTGSARADGAVTLGCAVRLAPADGGSLQLSGAINGAQAITAANGTSGVTRLTGRVGGSTAPTSITTTGTGTTAIGADVTTSGTQTFTGTLQINADVRLTGAGLEGSATVASDGPGRALTVDASSATAGTYSGQVQSNVAITKAGAGRLVLSGANGSAGAMRVDAGTLTAAAGGVLPAVTIAGGTLSGAGTAGAVSSAGSGSISVAAPSGLTTGSLASGGLTVDVGTLNSGTAGTTYGQVAVVGTVNLTGASLTATRGTTAAGDAFTVIANDGSDAVTGTFTGLAEGAAPAGWTGWSISYRGGDGNDVVLSRAGGATPDSGSGGAAGAGTGSSASTAPGNGGTGSAAAPATRATTIGKATAKRRVVSVVIDAATAGTATLRVTGKGGKPCSVTRRATAAGPLTLRCKVKGTVKAVRAVTTFTPAAGTAATRTDLLRLR